MEKSDSNLQMNLVETHVNSLPHKVVSLVIEPFMSQNSTSLKLFFFPLFVKLSEREISHKACQGPERDGFPH